MSEQSSFLVKYGSPKRIAELAKTTDSYTKKQISRRHPEYHEQFSHDPDESVRANVAKNTSDHKILNRLCNDPDPVVRGNVAEHGHKAHLDKLVDDKDGFVRSIVAKHGHKEHLDKLVNDRDGLARYYVAHHGHKEHLDKLVNDGDETVRQTVASHGYEEHHEKLKNDPNFGVRQSIARNTRHPAILAHMVNDSHPDISRYARDRSPLKESVLQRTRRLLKE